MMFCANVKIFNALLTNKFMPRLVRGFAFVLTKAVLVRKSRRTFGAHKPKAPSGRELPTKSGEGGWVCADFAVFASEIVCIYNVV